MYGKYGGTNPLNCFWQLLSLSNSTKLKSIWANQAIKQQFYSEFKVFIFFLSGYLTPVAAWRWVGCCTDRLTPQLPPHRSGRTAGSPAHSWWGWWCSWKHGRQRTGQWTCSSRRPQNTSSPGAQSWCSSPKSQSQCWACRELRDVIKHKYISGVI